MNQCIVELLLNVRTMTLHIQIPQALLQCDDEKEEISHGAPNVCVCVCWPITKYLSFRSGGQRLRNSERIKALAIEVKEMKEIIAKMGRKLGLT